MVVECRNLCLYLDQNHDTARWTLVACTGEVTLAAVPLPFHLLSSSQDRVSTQWASGNGNLWHLLFSIQPAGRAPKKAIAPTPFHKPEVNETLASEACVDSKSIPRSRRIKVLEDSSDSDENDFLEAPHIARDQHSDRDGAEAKDCTHVPGQSTFQKEITPQNCQLPSASLKPHTKQTHKSSSSRC